MQNDEIPEHLGQLIHASEARLSVLIADALALVDAGASDAAEAEQRMWREMDILEALRWQQWKIHGMDMPVSAAPLDSPTTDAAGQMDDPGRSSGR